MPFHGLKTDLELAALILTAVGASWLVSGQVFSNVLFTSLLASLFFLIGLHIDLGIFKAFREKKKQLGMSLIAVYLLTPIVAYLFSFLPGHLGEVFLVLGASGAALGSPKAWANLSKADGDLASYTATFSLLLAPVMVPLLLYLFPVNADFSILSQNLIVAVAPFVIGLLAQNYENQILQDMRIHFSKLAFWLIVVITLVQFRVILQAENLFYASELLTAVLFFAAFMVFSFGYSHLVSVFSGFYEKEARSIGFIGSCKNIAVAFFIASAVSAEAVFLVGLYYFVRQIMGIVFVDMYLHGEPKILERVGF